MHRTSVSVLPALVPSLLASLVLVASAAAASPPDVNLGELRSPARGLNGKTFRLKPGQRMRFQNYQPPPAHGDFALKYFYDLKGTPAGTLRHTGQILSIPAGRNHDGHFRQETFTVRKAAPVGTTIQVKGGNGWAPEWTVSFKILVVR